MATKSILDSTGCWVERHRNIIGDAGVELIPDLVIIIFLTAARFITTSDQSQLRVKLTADLRPQQKLVHVERHLKIVRPASPVKGSQSRRSYSKKHVIAPLPLISPSIGV